MTDNFVKFISKLKQKKNNSFYTITCHYKVDAAPGICTRAESKRIFVVSCITKTSANN
jgi:hypothetical protein